jgi:hypothetical protein
MYFLRVAGLIRRSNISEADFNAMQQGRVQKSFLGMIVLAGGVGMPEIAKIHSMARFKKQWKGFVTQCVEEWKNLNIISALLLR